MYATTSYLGIERGRLNYLFFLVTENYIETNQRIAEALHPLLTEFAKELGDTGAVVKPFDEHASKTFEEVINKFWSTALHDQLRERTPGLLILACDLRAFDPTRDAYIFVSFRDSMDEYGNVKAFEVRDLLNVLTQASRKTDLFESVRKYLQDRKRTEAASTAWEAVQLKPGVFGFSLDLKTVARALRQAFA